MCKYHATHTRLCAKVPDVVEWAKQTAVMSQLLDRKLCKSKRAFSRVRCWVWNTAVHSCFVADLWWSQLRTNSLPVWIQNGTLPSLWDRCGPLKLYLYSNRRWGGSSGVEAPAGTSAILWWSINTVRKANISKGALAAGRLAVDTAMFLYHCWRSAENHAHDGMRVGPTGRFLIGQFCCLILPRFGRAAQTDTRTFCESRRQVNKWNVKTRKKI